MAEVQAFCPQYSAETRYFSRLKTHEEDMGDNHTNADSNGLVKFSKSKKSKGSKKECSLLILGGSTSEERILNKQDTWGHRLCQSLNEKDIVRKECQDGFDVAKAAVNGRSIVANYFDILFWSSRFKQKFGTAVIYQGINYFQGDLLETLDWHVKYWQDITFGLRQNSIFLILGRQLCLQMQAGATS